MRRLILTVIPALLALPPPASPAEETADLAEVVRAREVAFARTMADRDHTAFETFLAEEAIFLDSGALHGREAVAEGWRPLFEGEEAPFSWRPERVVVTRSGTLALSTGSVHNAEGERIGTFNSTWRLEEDGEWRVVLDIGCPPCRCGAPEAPSDPPAAGEAPVE